VLSDTRLCSPSHVRSPSRTVAVVSVLGSNWRISSSPTGRISSDGKRQLCSSRQPGNLFAKPNTLVDIAIPIVVDGHYTLADFRMYV
jgi:hypothetical protein